MPATVTARFTAELPLLDRGLRGPDRLNELHRRAERLGRQRGTCLAARPAASMAAWPLDGHGDGDLLLVRLGHRDAMVEAAVNHRPDPGRKQQQRHEAKTEDRPPRRAEQQQESVKQAAIVRHVHVASAPKQPGQLPVVVQASRLQLFEAGVPPAPFEAGVPPAPFEAGGTPAPQAKNGGGEWESNPPGTLASPSLVLKTRGVTRRQSPPL